MSGRGEPAGEPPAAVSAPTEEPAAGKATPSGTFIAKAGEPED